jgi:hypothetical protein
MRIKFGYIVGFQLIGLLVYMVYAVFQVSVMHIPTDEVSLDTSYLKTAFWVLFGIWFCQPKEQGK